jgi:DedD protein
MARWEMRISLAQVIVLWLVLAGMMVMVFTFGYHAGREKGLRVALDENGQQTVRLPITTLVKPQEPRADAVLSNSATLESSAGEGVKPSEPRSQAKDGTSNSEMASMPPLADAQLALAGKLDTPEPEKQSLGQAETTRSIDFSKSEGFSDVTSAAESSEKRKLAELEEKMSAEEKMRAAKLKEEERRAAEAAKIEARKAKAARVAALKEKLRAAKLEKLEEAKRAEKARELAAQKAASNLKTNSNSSSLPSSDSLQPGWFAQAAATRSEKDAVAIARRFKIAGFNSNLERATVRGKQYFRVLVGPYGSRDAASAAREGIKSAGITNGEPFVKRVK